MKHKPKPPKVDLRKAAQDDVLQIINETALRFKEATGQFPVRGFISRAALAPFLKTTYCPYESITYAIICGICWEWEPRLSGVSCMCIEGQS